MDSTQEQVRTGGAGALRASLAEIVERQIRQKTHDRVGSLTVTAADGRLVIRGHCATYYVKQLVLAAVLEVAGDVSCQIEIDVRQVRPARAARR